MSRSFIIDLPAKPPTANSRSKVPQGEPVLGDVQVGVLALLVLQQVGVGHDMAADPVGVDQLEARAAFVTSSSLEVDVLEPADRLVRDAQGLEDLVVEATFSPRR